MAPTAVPLLADLRRQLLTPNHHQEMGSDAVEAA